MRILVTESRPGAGLVPGALLALDGYDVAFCHDTDLDPASPCVGLAPGRRCPLADGHVDLVVDVRPEPGPFTLRESGAMCALRGGVPLLVAGRPPRGSTLAEQAAGVCEVDDVVAGAARVVTPTGPAAHRLIREVLAPLLGPEGMPPDVRLTDLDGIVHVYITLVREIMEARVEEIRRAVWLACLRLTRGRKEAVVHIAVRTQPATVC